ncbi:MAG: glyoxalase/bleomycin resistance/extradiol dioxygenase family protein [Pirellulales bacterium]
MELHAYLTFEGNCAEALKFYERAIGAKVELAMTHGASPMAEHSPKEWHDKILHASVRVGSTSFFASDAPPGRYVRPAGFALSINLVDPVLAEKTFAALSEGGEVGFPLQKTFWAVLFGVVTDRFGTPWMVNCEEPRG